MMKAVKVDDPKPTQTKVDVDDGFSIRDALNILFCHKWKIILFFATITSVVTIITYRTPYVYSSEASLLIGVGRESIDIAPVLKPSQYLNQGQIERVNNEMVILKSRYLAAQTVDSIGLTHFFELFRKKTVDEFPQSNQPKTEEAMSETEETPKTENTDTAKAPPKTQTATLEKTKADHHPNEKEPDTAALSNSNVQNSETTKIEHKNDTTADGTDTKTDSNPNDLEKTKPQHENNTTTHTPKKNVVKCQMFTEQGKKKDSPELIESFARFEQLSEADRDSVWSGCQSAASIIVGSLNVEAKPQSFIVSVSSTTRNPLLAQLILENLIVAYINRYIELRTPKASVNVFKARFEKVKKDLENSEMALHSFRKQNQISDIGLQKNMLVSTVGELLSKINVINADVVALENKITELESIFKNYQKEVELQRIEGRSNQVADSLKSMLYKFKTEEAEVTFFYPDDSRKVQEVRARIAEVEKALASQPEKMVEVTRGISSQYTSNQMELDKARVDYVAAKSQLSVLQKELDIRQGELDKLSAHELDLTQLERQVELNKQLFFDELDVLKRADSYQALNDSKVVSVDIIETPSYETTPIKPNKPVNIVLGIIFGLLGGIGIAFIIDYFDDSMKTNEDVKRRLQLPVLAMVSSGDFYKCI